MSEASGTPPNRMMKAVQVQMTSVSVKTPRVWISPCFTGCETWAVAAIVLLGRQAFLLLADYTAQKRQGIKNPVFTKDRIPELKDKAECW